MTKIKRKVDDDNEETQLRSEINLLNSKITWVFQASSANYVILPLNKAIAYTALIGIVSCSSRTDRQMGGNTIGAAG